MKDKILDIVLPPIEKLSILYVLSQLVIGIILKYALGGTVFDLIGHLVIFLSALNVANLVEKYLKRKLNIIITIVIVGGSFILMQMLGIILIDNTLGIKPLFKQTKIENIQTKTSVLTFPGTSYSSSSVPTPDGVVSLLLTRIKEETPTLSCEMKDASTKYAITDKEAYRDISQNIDLNSDGIEELLVYPIEVCRNVIRGASGNGPIYIYQKQGDTWIRIGDLQGNFLKVVSDKTNGYYNIETNYHMSATSGITYLYEFKETGGTGGYTQINEIEYAE